MSIKSLDYLQPDPFSSFSYSNDTSPSPSPPKIAPASKERRHRRKTLTEDPRVPKEQIYTARRKSSSLPENELTKYVQEATLLPSLKVDEPRFTVKDSVIQSRVMQKIVSDSMTPHAYITTLHILSLCQRKAQTMSEKTRAKIKAVIQKKMELITGDLSYCIQQNLNIPTYFSKRNELTIDLERLSIRAKAIDSLAQILIPYMTYCELEKVELDTDFICIFPRINNILPEEKKFTISITSPFSNLKIASKHFKSHFPDLATEIQKWISGFENLSEVTVIDLSSTYLNDIPEQICRLLTHVKNLSFKDNKSVSSQILNSIQSLTTLEELDLSNNNFSDLPDTFFDSLVNLKVLDLSKNSFSKEAADQIQIICNERQIDLLI